jgi:hypothetical protein
MSDDEFLARVAVYLGRSTDGIEPETPIFVNDDGSIDRKKTWLCRAIGISSFRTGSAVRNSPAMRYLR